LTVAPQRRALIVGGSMAGLMAGCLLLRRGWDVQIFERVAGPLAGRGAGIVTHDVLRRVLVGCGVDAGENLGIPVELRRCFASDGRIVAEHRFPQLVTAWEHLFTLLRAAFPASRYHAGQALASLAQDEVGVRLRLADGGEVEGDILIGADGIRSMVRAALLPEATPAYADYIAWRGLSAEADFPADLRAEVFPHFTFDLPWGEQVLGYPVAGSGNDLRAGHRRYNTVWYRPADAASDLPQLLTDATGRQHEHSIPPPLIAPATIAAMRADAQRLLSPQFAVVMGLAPNPFLQPIYDLESPRMTVGRVALIGDAAFVARPHVGAGVSKAAEDALALVQALVKEVDVTQALARFEEQRLPLNRHIVERARYLGRCIASGGHLPDTSVAEPAAMLRDTATLDFLRVPPAA